MKEKYVPNQLTLKTSDSDVISYSVYRAKLSSH